MSKIFRRGEQQQQQQQQQEQKEEQDGAKGSRIFFPLQIMLIL